MTTTTRSMDERLLLPREISIKLSSRDDGGLRICSDDLPGLILSGTNISAMLRDLPKAITALIEHGGLRTQSPAPQPADDGEGELRDVLDPHDTITRGLIYEVCNANRKDFEGLGYYQRKDVVEAGLRIRRYFYNLALRRSHALSPAQDTAGLREANEDLRTHQEAWRKALQICVKAAEYDDDHSYWVHELSAFDRTFAALASTPSQPVPVGNK